MPMQIKRSEWVTQILDIMTGKSVLDVSSKKKEQVISMASKTPTSDKKNTVDVDSGLRLQGLVRLTGPTPNVLAEAFSFELRNIPAALFDSSGLLRQANKVAVSQYISSTAQVNDELPEQVSFVIDGGSLLHRLPWPRG